MEKKHVEWLTTKQVSEDCFGGELKPTTLEVWRCQGKGPAFKKFGRLVRYSRADVAAWIEQQTRTHTGQVSKNMDQVSIAR